MNLKAVLQWIEIGQKVIEAGAPAWQSLKAALAKHGIETDTEQLNAVIIDAERRRLIAEAEAKS
jgi:hypothetical protein